MIFSSYEFIYVFLPIVVITYFILSKLSNMKIQHIFLIISSLVFYSWFNISYLWIIIFSIIFNYIIVNIMNSCEGKKRIIFILGVVINVLLLGYFKYYDFFIENLNYIFKTNFMFKNIILPLGISFFTFQQISFLLSCYKGEEKISGFIEYSLFVTFFPQLVAGPIVLYSEMMPQFKEKNKRYINWDNISKGLYIFSIGLFKKIVVADTLALWANNGFDNISNLGFAAAWITTLSYTLQVYFDFSGYSDMAIGLAKMLNIDLPVNFNSPYKSKNIGEFWRRWHITLGRALSQYIYIPLGGNRKGEIKTYRNLIITFFISGLWHGASWLFIIWGTLHGIANVVYRIWKKTHIKVNDTISVFITFIFVNFTWVLFRAENFRQAKKVINAMFNIKNINFIQIGELLYDGMMNLPLILGLGIIIFTIVILLIIIFKSPNSIELTNNFKMDNKRIMATAMMLYISTICLSRVSVFIYFNF